jgi:DNA-binding transcriptional MerR regulator
VRPLFTIGAVARMLELSPATIRTWETRYRFVVPERSSGGQRLYSREQVDQLRFVRDEVAGGRRPSEAHRLLGERVASGETLSSPFVRVLVAESKFGAAALLRRLVGAEGFEVVLADDPAEATRTLDELAPTVAVVDVEDAGYADLLRELRERGARVLPAHGLLAHARSLES